LNRSEAAEPMRTSLLLVLLLATPLAAQTVTPQAPAFEVASIRRSADVSARIVTPSNEFLPGGVWRVRDLTIRNLIRSLYPDQARWQIVGGPEWTSQELYDIEARGHTTASAEEVRAMARKLLADRLRLDVHNETRELPVFVLTLPKGRRLGPGFTNPAVDCAPFRAGGERPQDHTRQPFADRLSCAMVVMPTSDRTLKVPGANLRLSAGDATLTEIVPLLGGALGRPVLDQTGVTGRFDIELQYSSLPLSTTTVDTGPALRTAIAEQLGLSVDDSRAPIEVLVIDRVERPSAN
jgi:uncharacterized protein (TIGR03435 family)